MERMATGLRRISLPQIATSNTTLLGRCEARKAELCTARGNTELTFRNMKPTLDAAYLRCERPAYE
jgi:hypothetical protein